MSDREGGDDDVGLPKATVFKLIQGESALETFSFPQPVSHVPYVASHWSALTLRNATRRRLYIERSQRCDCGLLHR